MTKNNKKIRPRKKYLAPQEAFHLGKKDFYNGILHPIQKLTVYAQKEWQRGFNVAYGKNKERLASAR